MKPDTQEADNLFIEARGFYSKGDTNEALKILRTLEENHPDYKNTFWLLAVIYRSVLNDSETAEQYYKKALIIDKHYKEVLYDYANLLHTQNRYDELKTLVEQQMVPIEGVDRVLIYEYLGLIAEYQKEYGKAVGFYKKALSLATQNNNYEYYKQAIARCNEKRNPIWYSMTVPARIASVFLSIFFIFIIWSVITGSSN